MAYTKKETEKVDEIENKVENNVRSVKTTEVDELKETVSQLKAQNEMLMKMFMQLQNQQQSATVVEPQFMSTLNNEYTLVHLVECAPGLSTHIELSNITIDMSAFGEERLIDRRQAEELAGKYRKWFEKGIIAFGADGDDLASKFGLKSVNDYSYINKDFVRQLGNLSLIELENLYNKVSDGHKKFIIEYFKRKIVDNDKSFRDIHKIEMLNRISNGAMQGTQLDMQNQNTTDSENK